MLAADCASKTEWRTPHTAHTQYESVNNGPLTCRHNIFHSRQFAFILQQNLKQKRNPIYSFGDFLKVDRTPVSLPHSLYRHLLQVKRKYVQLVWYALFSVRSCAWSVNPLSQRRSTVLSCLVASHPNPMSHTRHREASSTMRYVIKRK